MKAKQILLAITILTITTPAQANEISGTRVEGQGALCAEGQGKAVEINIALKKEFSYCFVLPTRTPIPILTPTPTPTPLPTTSVNTDTTLSNSAAPENVVSVSDSATATSVAKPTPTPTPTQSAAPAKLDLPERNSHVEINATTQEVIIREETIEEWLNRIFAAWANWFDNFMYFWGWTS